MMSLVAMKNNKRNQQGLTLIELLVAMGLGVFLLAGIVQVFVGSRASFDVIRAQSGMQESARFAMSFISQASRQAGYINAGNVDTGNEYAIDLVNVFNGSNPRWPAQDGFEDSSVVVGFDDAAGAPAAIQGVTVKAETDVFAIRQQGDPDGLMMDCEGIALSVDTAEYIRMTFFVGDDDQLYCEVFDGTALRAPVALVSGIEDMQVLYGIGGLPDDRFRVQKYIAANTVTADEWYDVMTIRVGLMSISDNQPLATTAKSYTLLDKQIDDVSDGRARQTFTKTIALRSNLSS